MVWIAAAKPASSVIVAWISIDSSTVDRKSTRLNSSHTVIYTLSLHDALPILGNQKAEQPVLYGVDRRRETREFSDRCLDQHRQQHGRSEEHTSELQSHRDLHSFPTRRSSDLRQSESGTTSAVWCGSPPRNPRVQ